MEEITNDKISGLQPIWNPYPGFSLLFNNPYGLSAIKTDENIYKINLEFKKEHNKSNYDFYHTCKTTLDKLDSYLPREKYLFCRLPFSSYHVTVWDGLNIGNYKNVSDEYFEIFKKGFRKPKEDESWISKFQKLSPLIKKVKEINPGQFKTTISFQFKELKNFGNGTFAVGLKPIRESEENFKKINKARRTLNEAFRKEFGVRINFRNHYTPHISQAYFANPKYAQKVTLLYPEWNNIFEDALKDKTVTFESVSLYYFIDMATFLRI